MQNSQTASHGINLSFQAAFKYENEEEQTARRTMASDLCHQPQELNSTLMSFCSAPSSLPANFIDSPCYGCKFNALLRTSNIPEADCTFSRYMSCSCAGSAYIDVDGIGEEPSTANQINPQFMTGIEHETEVTPQSIGFASPSQMMHHTTSQPNYSSANEPGIEIPYQNSLSTDTAHMKSSGNSSHLIRHSSSPAGFLSHLKVENGYGVMRGGTGSVRGGNDINGEAIASNSRLKNQITLLSRQASSPGQMSISEMVAKSIGASSPDDGSFVNPHIPGRIPVSSWDDSSRENFPLLKRFRNTDGTIVSNLNPSESQENGEMGNQTPSLTHQLSLPKIPSEMAAMEQFLQFQDSVPCRVRAKRGCATHPRSIAERVRRTRISERMRKLQELVPNMDKQTNTADMLDLAVDYIKDLQRQVKAFSDNRASCSCQSKQKPYATPAA